MALMRDKCFRFGLKSTVLLLRGKPNTHLCKHVTVAEELEEQIQRGRKKISKGERKKKKSGFCIVITCTETYYSGDV